MNLALQLYTIRDGISDKQSLAKALENVAKIGYKGVEFAGFYGYEAAELRAKLDELGLQAISCHVGLDDLKQPLYDYAKLLGCQGVVLAGADTSTPEKTAALCEKLKEKSANVKACGMTLMYHNHDHEFVPQNDILPIDEIKKACMLEADTYWVFRAGHDTTKFLIENQDKIALIHLKDGKRHFSEPCAIGEGENDIAAIFKAANEINSEWIIVENDNPVPNGIEDVKRSYDYIMSKKFI